MIPDTPYMDSACCYFHDLSSEAPIDVILYGTMHNRKSGRCEDVGLALKPDYRVRVTVVRSDQYGLPQTRQRVYILMIRKDVGDEALADAIIHLVTVGFRQVHSRATTHDIAMAVQGFARGPDSVPGNFQAGGVLGGWAGESQGPCRRAREASRASTRGFTCEHDV